MGKVSPVSIKYIIRAKFFATGTVEKPDVIGALFGQTEGLLGAELELRQLQKEGKIGRIDVKLEVSEGKTVGAIEIPSALDKTETTLIAASLETIERIGPSDSKIEIEGIEDVRGSKREYIIERAKKLLEQINSTVPETQEIQDAVTVSARVSRLQGYGEEQLPAGDLSGEDIIVVEGRADVINLLKHGVNNVIGMNGTVLQKAIQDLAKEKSLTLFIDGDRGGMLIAKNVMDNLKVEYIASAPDGKEVEELSGKEILASLRRRIPSAEFRLPRGNNLYKKTEAPEERAEAPELGNTEKEKLKSLLYELVGTRGAYIVDREMDVSRKIPSGEIINALHHFNSRIYAIVIDGTATVGIIKAAERVSCKYIVARNFASCQTPITLLSM